jgi:hypothetical protein
MFGKKKRDKKGLPDLPEIETPIPSDRGPRTVEEEIPYEKHNLPTFPDSPNNKGFSQSAIKEAVDTGPSRLQLPELERITPDTQSHQNIKTIEMEEWSPHAEKEQNIPPISTIKRPPKELPQIKIQELPNEEISAIPALPNKSSDIETMPVTPPGSKRSNIFVKINKFNSAKRALADIEDKLKDIDGLLKKIRETKMREEQELDSWEKEVNTVKARIQEVTDNIFEKID